MFNRLWFAFYGNFFRFLAFRDLLVNLDQQEALFQFRIIHLSMFRQRKTQLEIRLTNTTINPVRLILYRLFSVFTRNIQVAANRFNFKLFLFPAGTLTVSR